MAQALSSSDNALACHWQGSRVGIREVLEAIRRFRHHQARGGVQVSTVTLLALAGDRAAGGHVLDTVRVTGSHRPGRVVLVVIGGDDAGMDAEVRLYKDSSEGIQRWSEEVTLNIGGPVRDHLDSLVEPLLPPEVPVALWLAPGLEGHRSLLDRSQAVCEQSDVVVIDSAPATSLGTPGHGAPGHGEIPLACALELARTHPLMDLAWVRQAPWRRALAALGAGASAAQESGSSPALTRVVAEGPQSAPLLLACWLACVASIPAQLIVTSPSQRLRLALETAAQNRGQSLPGPSHSPERTGSAKNGQADQENLSVVVEASDGDPFVHGKAELQGSTLLEVHSPIPSPLRVWALRHALAKPVRDPLWEKAARLGIGIETIKASPINGS